MRSDILAEITTKYGGALTWNSFLDDSGVTIPAFEAPLLIKDSTMPVRKARTTEIYTIPSEDHRSNMDTTTALLFRGAPDVLQVQISGFILTPVLTDSNGHFTGWNTPFGNYTYGEVVSMYLEGSISKTVGGAPLRVDPDYYTTPNGQQYTKPIVAQWDTGQTVTPTKQTFTATIYLER